MLKPILLICGLICSMQVFAQAPAVQDVENTILDHLHRIEFLRGDTSVSESDSLTSENDALMRFMLKACTNNIAALKAPFKKLDNSEMKVVSSKDGRFRIFSWDTETGGTMHFFDAIIQYQDAAGTKAIEIKQKKSAADSSEQEDPGYWYKGIYTVSGKNAKIFYLPFYIGMYSTKYVAMGIRAFSIDNGLLNDSVQLFQATNKSLNSIDVAYDYFSNYDYKTMKERNEIHINGDKLYIPLVNGETVTNRSLIYKFDGYKFIFDKNEK